jgi:hypothetical protein
METNRINRFSPRTLLARMNAPQPKTICKYFNKTSQIIKPHNKDDYPYTDTHIECSFLHQRITKKHCTKCQHYEKLS